MKLAIAITDGNGEMYDHTEYGEISVTYSEYGQGMEFASYHDIATRECTASDFGFDSEHRPNQFFSSPLQDKWYREAYPDYLCFDDEISI